MAEIHRDIEESAGDHSVRIVFCNHAVTFFPLEPELSERIEEWLRAHQDHCHKEGVMCTHRIFIDGKEI